MQFRFWIVLQQCNDILYSAMEGFEENTWDRFFRYDTVGERELIHYRGVKRWKRTIWTKEAWVEEIRICTKRHKRASNGKRPSNIYVSHYRPKNCNPSYTRAKAREIRWTSQSPGYVVRSFWHKSCQFTSKMNFKLFMVTLFVTVSESKTSNCMVYKNLDRGKEFSRTFSPWAVHFITADLWIWQWLANKYF